MDSVTTVQTQMDDVSWTLVFEVSPVGSVSDRHLSVEAWPSSAMPTLTVTSLMGHPGTCTL